jgi:hypothetical protein
MRASLAVLAVVGALATSCGGDDTAEVATSETTRSLPPCAGARALVETPPGFPADFPLPPGTVLTSAASPYANQLVVLGLIPGDVQEAAGFFSDSLPDSGYQVGVGDAEGTESEAPFTGNGFRGKWRVNGITGCDAVKLTLVLIEQA